MGNLIQKKPLIDMKMVINEKTQILLQDLLCEFNFEKNSIWNYQALNNVQEKKTSLSTSELLQLLNILQMFKKLNLM